MGRALLMLVLGAGASCSSPPAQVEPGAAYGRCVFAGDAAVGTCNPGLACVPAPSPVETAWPAQFCTRSCALADDGRECPARPEGATGVPRCSDQVSADASVCYQDCFSAACAPGMVCVTRAQSPSYCAWARP
jgi:hypothetical protein